MKPFHGIHYRSPEFIIYVKEFPFLFVEKLLSPENGKFIIGRLCSLLYGKFSSHTKSSPPECNKPVWKFKHFF